MFEKVLMLKTSWRETLFYLIQPFIDVHLYHYICNFQQYNFKSEKVETLYIEAICLWPDTASMMDSMFFK